MKRAPRIAFLTMLVGCAPVASRTAAPSVPSVVLHSPEGDALPLDAALREHPATVITFFSAHCPCQRAHDGRLLDLMAKEARRGIGYLVVDSEESATAATDAADARARGYPIWRDDAGQLARALGAEYATYSVVVDATGNVLYRGGFDSDRTHLRERRATYLEDAVDDVVAHRGVRRAEAKALGCSLELR